MLKLLLGVLVTLLLGLGLQTYRLSSSQSTAAKLLSTVQALEGTLDRNSRATAVHKRALVQAQAESRAAVQALEQALAASPDWAASPVPQEVQDAP